MQFSNASHQTSQFDFITLLTLPAKKKKKKQQPANIISRHGGNFA